MTVEYTIISIGTMSRNLLWNESRAVRSAHATTTLVVAGERRILVDPSLPGNILAPRFFERTGKELSSVTDVFCTTLHPDSRRALNDSLEHANLWCSEVEREWYAGRLEELAESSDRLGSDDAEALEAERRIVTRFAASEDQLATQVGLFPLPGVTPGSCGLLLTPPTRTILIAGPAVPTREHLQQGMVSPQAADREQAMESLRETLELADLIIPGYDNLLLAPQRWM